MTCPYCKQCKWFRNIYRLFLGGPHEEYFYTATCSNCNHRIELITYKSC